jgi:hypothetical protein
MMALEAARRGKWSSGALLMSLVFWAASVANAAIEHAPPSFPVSVGGDSGNATFVDMQTAVYRIVYDTDEKRVDVRTEIEFISAQEGFPLFDLVPNPSAVELNGEAVSTRLISDPDGETKFRVIERKVPVGRHLLQVNHRIAAGVSFKDLKAAGVGVSSAFWMSDLTDRRYLEQYLPANLEYDSVAMRMEVLVQGSAAAEHELYVNGAIQSSYKNSFHVEFPSYYTASSVFYHLVPKGTFPSTRFDYRSIDGRRIPVTIYTSASLSSFSTSTKKVLDELESDYGPFPHDQLVIYGAGSGGMEYSGATMTSLWALGHELFHSYNARAVMPARGNDGWIDEAMASWRDAGYQLRSVPGSVTRMAGHSQWSRRTDDAAYTKGRDFLAWIAHRMSVNAMDMKAFLREYLKANLYSSVTTELFRSQLEGYTRMELYADFEKYVYGKGSSKTVRGSKWKSSWKGGLKACSDGNVSLRPEEEFNPYHPRLSREELDALLWPRI